MRFLNAIRRLRYFLRRKFHLSAKRELCSFWVNDSHEYRAILSSSCPVWMRRRIPVRLLVPEEMSAIARSKPDPGALSFSMFSGYIPVRIPF